MPYNYTTDGGIAYEEIEGSPTFRADRDGFSATQIYHMAWIDIDAFLDESFPLPVRGGFAYQYVRERTFPGTDWLFTKSVSIEALNPEKPTAGPQINVYDDGAKVTIDYATRTIELDTEGGRGGSPTGADTGTLQTHQMSIGGEAMILPIGAFGWEFDNPPLLPFKPAQTEDVRVSKIIPMIEHSLSFEYVPHPPFTTIAAMIGTVNSATLLFNAQPETLLFLGADATRRVTPQGTEAWKLEYRFSQKIVKGRVAGDIYEGYEAVAIGWNHFFHPGYMRWDKLQTTDGDNVYKTANFAPLFQAEGGGEA